LARPPDRHLKLAALPSAWLDALLKRSFQSHGLLVLLEQVSEGLVKSVLEALAGSLRERLDRFPRLIIELNALAGHGSV
jgi:hypothetical protein